MNLFSKIYTILLMGIIGLLILVGNLHYESRIRQFEEDMTVRAEAVGRAVAAVIAGIWGEGGAEAALRRMGEADDADPLLTMRWVWPDEACKRFGKRQPEVCLAAAPENARVVSFTSSDENRQRQRFTLVSVHLPGGERQGVLQLSQPLVRLTAFTQKILFETLAVTAVLALISCLSVYFLIYSKLRRPLEKLCCKALEIGKGNLTADLEIRGDEEMVHLARSMNDMCTRLLIAQEKIHFENLARLKTLEQLRHTEKLSTVGQIAAGIAHEIGTPLNVVDGRAKMIISESLEMEEVINCAKIIKAQAERMTRIIRQLLDFSRKKKVIQKARENVVTLIRQVFHLLTPLASKQGIRLELKVAGEAKVSCLVDGQQIQQVFMNVIMNAIQATPEQGSVLVEVTNLRMKSLIHTDGLLQDLLRIDIRDEGEGISEANLKEIFTPFFTTKSIGLGTGLGLSIARELLEEHGGWIEVRNRPTRGAEFALYLKLEESWQ